MDAVDRGPDADPVSTLTRWEEFGAVWRVIARTSGEVTVSLCRCDDGEEAHRVRSSDPALLSYIGDRSTSSD